MACASTDKHSEKCDDFPYMHMYAIPDLERSAREGNKVLRSYVDDLYSSPQAIQ
jgi:hypothetical protein